ncbi:MAG: hypothetical protein H7Y88_11915, partial [Phycisphaerales bacterium]|nr:hypothetical protein [Phycisphaerales bacterium]
TYQGHRDERASLVDIFQRIAARYSLDPAPPHTPPRRYNPPRASPEPPSYREAG